MNISSVTGWFQESKLKHEMHHNDVKAAAVTHLIIQLFPPHSSSLIIDLGFADTI